MPKCMPRCHPRPIQPGCPINQEYGPGVVSICCVTMTTFPDCDDPGRNTSRTLSWESASSDDCDIDNVYQPNFHTNYNGGSYFDKEATDTYIKEPYTGMIDSGSELFLCGDEYPAPDPGWGWRPYVTWRCIDGDIEFRVRMFPPSDLSYIGDTPPLWMDPDGSLTLGTVTVPPTWYLDLPVVVPMNIVHPSASQLDATGYVEINLDCSPVNCPSLNCFPNCISSSIDCAGTEPTHALLFVEIEGPAGCCLNGTYNLAFDGSPYYHMEPVSCTNGASLELWLFCDGTDVKLRERLVDPTGGVSDTTQVITLSCVDGNVSFAFDFFCGTFRPQDDYCDGLTGTVYVTIFSNN